MKLILRSYDHGEVGFGYTLENHRGNGFTTSVGVGIRNIVAKNEQRDVCFATERGNTIPERNAQKLNFRVLNNKRAIEVINHNANASKHHL